MVLYTSDEKHHINIDISSFSNKFGKYNFFDTTYRKSKKENPNETPKIVLPVLDEESLKIIIKFIHNGYLLLNNEDITHHITFNETEFYIPESKKGSPNYKFIKVLFDYYCIDIYRGLLQPHLITLYGNERPQINGEIYDKYTVLFENDLVVGKIRDKLINKHFNSIKDHAIKMHQLLREYMNTVLDDNKNTKNSIDKNNKYVELVELYNNMTGLINETFDIKTKFKTKEGEKSVLKELIYEYNSDDDNINILSWEHFYEMLEKYEGGYMEFYLSYTKLLDTIKEKYNFDDSNNDSQIKIDKPINILPWTENNKTIDSINDLKFPNYTNQNLDF